MSFEKCLGNIKGDQGIQGPKGDTFKFSDLTDEEIDSLLERFKIIQAADIYFDNETGLLYISDYEFNVINADINQEIPNKENPNTPIKPKGAFLFEEISSINYLKKTINFYPSSSELYTAGTLLTYIIEENPEVSDEVEALIRSLITRITYLEEELENLGNDETDLSKYQSRNFITKQVLLDYIESLSADNIEY